MRLPCVLTIGGLDPSGGAGLAADVRAARTAEAFACPVAAAWTVQSTAGLRAAQALSPRDLLAQVREVAAHQRIRTAKIGALGSEANVRAVATWLWKRPELPVVVDPVILPSRGSARLLPNDALVAMRERLVPRATLVTPNAAEASALTGLRVRSLEDACDAAYAIVELGAGACLVKGGHVAPRAEEAVDVLVLRSERVLVLRVPRLRVPPVHGTGCTLASLIAGRLAHEQRAGEEAVVRAVRWGKQALHAALERTADIGQGMRVI